MVTEEDVLARYSTDGLRKRELDRFAKKDHLDSLKVDPERRDEILNELYGVE